MKFLCYNVEFNIFINLLDYSDTVASSIALQTIILLWKIKQYLPFFPLLSTHMYIYFIYAHRQTQSKGLKYLNTFNFTKYNMNRKNLFVSIMKEKVPKYKNLLLHVCNDSHMQVLCVFLHLGFLILFQY